MCVCVLQECDEYELLCFTERWQCNDVLFVGLRVGVDMIWHSVAADPIDAVLFAVEALGLLVITVLVEAHEAVALLRLARLLDPLAELFVLGVERAVAQAGQIEPLQAAHIL